MSKIPNTNLILKPITDQVDYNDLKSLMKERNKIQVSLNKIDDRIKVQTDRSKSIIANHQAQLKKLREMKKSAKSNK